jgi:hypothetical protein
MPPFRDPLRGLLALLLPHHATIDEVRVQWMLAVAAALVVVVLGARSCRHSLRSLQPILTKLYATHG